MKAIAVFCVYMIFFLPGVIGCMEAGQEDLVAFIINAQGPEIVQRLEGLTWVKRRDYPADTHYHCSKV